MVENLVPKKTKVPSSEQVVYDDWFAKKLIPVMCETCGGKYIHVWQAIKQKMHEGGTYNSPGSSATVVTHK